MMGFVSKWVRKEREGVMSTINPTNHTIEYTTQRGEVVVKLEKPVGVPEQKE